MPLLKNGLRQFPNTIGWKWLVFKQKEYKQIEQKMRETIKMYILNKKYY